MQRNVKRWPTPRCAEDRRRLGAQKARRLKRPTRPPRDARRSGRGPSWWPRDSERRAALGGGPSPMEDFAKACNPRYMLRRTCPGVNHRHRVYKPLTNLACRDYSDGRSAVHAGLKPHPGLVAFRRKGTNAHVDGRHEPRRRSMETSHGCHPVFERLASDGRAPRKGRTAIRRCAKSVQVSTEVEQASTEADPGQKIPKASSGASLVTTINGRS